MMRRGGSRRGVVFFLLLGTGLVAPAAAERLVPCGVLGNSGATGDSLVRVDPAGFHNQGSGVAALPDRSLWYSGGDRINHLSLSGALIASFPLRPEGSRVETNAFALLDGRLYFLGRLPKPGPRALFVLPVDGSAPTAVALPTAPPPAPSLDTLLLAAQPLDGKLVLLGSSASGKELEVYFHDPQAGAPECAFSLDANSPTGVAVDPKHRVIYVGGRVFPGSDLLGITAVTPEGQRVSPQFPVAASKVGGTPVSYYGHVNWAGDALWDLAWYGFLMRMDLAGQTDPGSVAAWHHELGGVFQILDLGDCEGRTTDVVACATYGDEALYLGHWEPALRKLQWVRRLGCLPVMVSLWVTPEGWVSVGTSRTQAWWRFEDAPDAPMRRPELGIAVTPPVQRENRYLAMAAPYWLDELLQAPPISRAFSREPRPNNEAQRLTEAIPLKQPIGLTAEDPAADGRGRLFVSDADTRKLWQTTLDRPSLMLDNTQWKPLTYADPATEKLMETATDLAWRPDNSLLVAVDGGLVVLQTGQGGYEVARRFEQWGDALEARFGRHLRFCLAGDRLLVSDTDRQRALLFDARTWTLLAQAGTTDQPGDGLRQFDHPTLVSLSSGRAVVADTGNQRVVKVLVAP